jgi:copper chaperone
MKILKFKSDIKCMGCVAKVTPTLDKAEGIAKWDVNINSPEKILTIETEKLSSEDIQELVKKAGFKAEEM